MAVLQVEASVAFPCGVEAAVLKPSRCAWKACFIGPSTCGAVFAIFVKQASYFLMYSSHSGTPVFGSLVSALAVSVFAGAVVVFVVVVVVVDELAVVVFAGLALTVVFVAAPPQPNEMIAKQKADAIARMLLIFIKSRFLTNIFFSEPLPRPERR